MGPLFCSAFTLFLSRTLQLGWSSCGLPDPRTAHLGISTDSYLPCPFRVPGEPPLLLEYSVTSSLTYASPHGTCLLSYRPPAPPPLGSSCPFTVILGRGRYPWSPAAAPRGQAAPSLSAALPCLSRSFSTSGRLLFSALLLLHLVDTALPLVQEPPAPMSLCPSCALALRVAGVGRALYLCASPSAHA